MTTDLGAAPDPTGLDNAVLEYARQRGITEVLHFTTNPGLLGILASGGVLSRDGLSADKYIEHIYTPNCADRLKDAAWTGYVNLSITKVNKRMLDSSESWHRQDGVWWSVLAFRPELLACPGVQFCTTNNTYHQCVRRDPGVAGLTALFAPVVEWGYHGSRKVRGASTLANMPTDPQAEVLFPDQVPLTWLQAIYVRDEENIDDVQGWLGTFDQLPRVPVQWKPEVFG